MAELCSNICLRGGIDAQCEGGMGGIKRVVIANWGDDLFTTYQIDEFHPISYVEANPTGGTCGTGERPESPAAEGWYRFSFRKNTASMTSTLNIDEANGTNYVTTDLVLQFNKMEENKRIAIVSLCQTPVAVIVQDANDQYWALGVEEPVLASAGEGVTGTNRTDSNHYSITLQDTCTVMPIPCQNGAAIFAGAHT